MVSLVYTLAEVRAPHLSTRTCNVCAISRRKEGIPYPRAFLLSHLDSSSSDRDFAVVAKPQ